ncbi:hypothetical protein [Aeromicrobium sp. Root472D3]|uniref:hypothetical protein n=1 Tax=Aeromicrobium sp. Root472D3 TaxID=1736540 RepID=UPI0006F616D1|nr:hypothetical protein [Aeromicrobium sp. Root472D3]KQX74500.1 hypothetical protein ASD10_04495 [Aeromicrobium sp. Root472D3]
MVNRVGGVRGAAAVGLTPDLRAALDDLIDRTAAGADPAQVVRTVGGVLRDVNHHLDGLRRLRLDAIAALRDGGSSHADIATSTGLSRTRAAQLAHAAAHRMRDTAN